MRQRQQGQVPSRTVVQRRSYWGRRSPWSHTTNDPSSQRNGIRCGGERTPALAGDSYLECLLTHIGEHLGSYISAGTPGDLRKDPSRRLEAAINVNAARDGSHQRLVGPVQLGCPCRRHPVPSLQNDIDSHFHELPSRWRTSLPGSGRLRQSAVLCPIDGAGWAPPY